MPPFPSLISFSPLTPRESRTHLHRRPLVSGKTPPEPISSHTFLSLPPSPDLSQAHDPLHLPPPDDHSNTAKRAQQPPDARRAFIFLLAPPGASPAPGKPEADVVVIGSGIGGLCCAGLLARYEQDVPVLESHDLPGGAAHSFEIKGYKFDSGPSLFSAFQSRGPQANPLAQFVMAGTLVCVLIHTDVTKYLNFNAVDGSYVYNKGKIYKVPATDVEALKSSLMGLFEKRHARKFFIYVRDYEENDPKSHEGFMLSPWHVFKEDLHISIHYMDWPSFPRHLLA